MLFNTFFNIVKLPEIIEGITNAYVSKDFNSKMPEEL